MPAAANTPQKKNHGWPWIWRQQIRSTSALRLFLLPPAGGSSVLFRGWERALPEGVDICPIQLPGRGARLNEPLFTRLDPLVKCLGDALVPVLDKPFALFGHSMGALIAFELARYVRRLRGIEPVILFASGANSPDVPLGRKDYLLPDSEFIAMLRELKGTPPELLNDPEALWLLLPMLRADFEATQTHEYRAEPPLSGAIVAFGGAQDSTTTNDLLLPWARHTSGAFFLTLLPGGHFFIEESREQLLTIMARELRCALDQVRAH